MIVASFRRLGIRYTPPADVNALGARVPDQPPSRRWRVSDGRRVGALGGRHGDLLRHLHDARMERSGADTASLGILTACPGILTAWRFVRYVWPMRLAL